MNTIRPCGCKGVRTCLQCEKDYNIQKPNLCEDYQKLHSWVYCPACECIYEGWQTDEILAEHPDHKGAQGKSFPGVLVKCDFLTTSEGEDVLRQLDELPWTISQSGRRKQNFGPKTNFKKRKLQNGSFSGFPAFTEFIQKRFRENVKLLRDFQTIEQCTLEYDPVKGACIDPHIDDCWIWGERVVTVNCLGDSVLTLTNYDPSKDVRKYNLDIVEEYRDKLLIPWLETEELKEFKNTVIRIPMPNLSLIVLLGAPRYQFEHSVLREDIKQRRVCIAYREFTPMYIDGVEQERGNVVTQNAQLFWPHKQGLAVNSH